MDRSPKQCCCKHHSLLQRLRTRVCLALSLPTVNAAPMYKRLTPIESVDTQDKPDDHDDSVQNFKEETATSSELELSKEELKDTGEKVGDGGGERLSDFAKKLLEQRNSQTPWERIKGAYTLDGSTRYIPLEYWDLLMTSTAAYVLGFVYGGYPALRLGKKRYIERSQGAAYETRFHAVSDSVGAGNRGLVRYGMRWGWRVTFMATAFQGLSTVMSLYRNKVDIFNYGTAAFTTGAVYRFNMGITGMLGGGFAGLVIGIPAGCSLLLLQRIVGMNALERTIQHKSERLLDWNTDRDTYMKGNADAIELMDAWLKETDKERETKQRKS